MPSRFLKSIVALSTCTLLLEAHASLVVTNADGSIKWDVLCTAISERSQAANWVSEIVTV